MRRRRARGRHYAYARSAHWPYHRSVSADTQPSVEEKRADRKARLASRLEQARDGEPHALDDIVRELNPLLWHVARTAGLTSDQAADVVQTTWLELVRRMREIRSPLELTAWLVTTTRREAWHLRQRQRRQGTDGIESVESFVDPGPEPYERLLSDEQARVLWRHFRRLPQRCRALLRVVAQVERPDYAAMAEALDMPRGSIGPTRGRCLAKLRAMLLADPAWSPS
jgi:RNA polymerase sigma factor (sigma-70 family)